MYYFVPYLLNYLPRKSYPTLQLQVITEYSLLNFFFFSTVFFHFILSIFLIRHFIVHFSYYLFNLIINELEYKFIKQKSSNTFIFILFFSEKKKQIISIF